MIKEIKRQAYLNRKDPLVGLAVCAAMGLIFSILSVVLFRTDEDAAYLGTILFMVAACVMGLLQSISAFGTIFNLALKMGAVRRQYLAAALVVNWAGCFVTLLASYVWRLVDKLLFAAVGIAEGASLPVGVLAMLGISLVAVVVGGWIGALLQRYGKVAFWILWVVWVFGGLSMSRIAHMLETENPGPLARVLQAVARALHSLPPVLLWLLPVVILLALGLHLWLMLHKARAAD